VRFAQRSQRISPSNEGPDLAQPPQELFGPGKPKVVCPQADNPLNLFHEILVALTGS
jgi:hypothetical protein